MSTRERKLRVIGDKYALYRAVDDMLIHKGADWLTDEQIGDLIHQKLVDNRSRRRIERHNRAIREGELAELPRRAGLVFGNPPGTCAEDVLPTGPEAA